MATIKIFETSAGYVYAFPQEQELERVKRKDMGKNLLNS